MGRACKTGRACIARGRSRVRTASSKNRTGTMSGTRTSTLAGNIFREWRGMRDRQSIETRTVIRTGRPRKLCGDLCIVLHSIWEESKIRCEMAMHLRILPGKECLVIGAVSFELSTTLMHCLLNFLPGEMQGKSEYSKLLYSPRVIDPSTFTREEDIVWPTVVRVLFDVLGTTSSRWCRYGGSTDETVSWNICCRLSLLCTASAVKSIEEGIVLLSFNEELSLDGIKMSIIIVVELDVVKLV